MKQRLLLALLITIVTLSSCNKDDINDLKKRVGKLEDIIGSNQPIAMKYATKDNDNNDIITNMAFYFKASDESTSYAYPNADGTYDVYIERFSDVEWYEGAWMDFTYDPSSGAVTSVYRMGAYFTHSPSGRYQNAYFNSYQTENERSINIKSFDLTTGKIELTATATSTNAYSSNEYSGKGMSLELTFKGTVAVYE